MKRNVKIFAATIALGAMCMMTACSGEELDATIVEETIDGSHWERADINLNVNRVNFDAQAGATRSADEGWKDGDRIYLILKDKDGNNVQAYVEYDATEASWGQVEYDGYKSYLTCTTPRTVEAYFFDGTVNVTTSDITFDATTGVYACKDGIYTYPSNGDLEVSISLVPLTSRIRFKGDSDRNFSLSGITTYTAFSRTTGALTTTSSKVSTIVYKTSPSPYIYGVFTNPERPTLAVTNSSGNVFVTVFDASTNVLQVGHSGYMTVPTEDKHRGWKQVVTPATGISLNRSKLAMIKDHTATLGLSLTPTNATSDIVWSSSNTSVVEVSDAGVLTAVATGTATITAVVEENANLTASCSVTVIDSEYEFVDLGLTSGTLWATMNVGAASPSDYGDYFAWGEVESKTNFSWSTYKYCNNGSRSSLTKYCHDSDNGTVDKKQELEFLDDAARQNWGGSWRMPSRAQFTELINECTWKWTTLDGVIYGYQVISKKDSSNSIFLPAAGYYSGTTLVNSGASGNYWTRENYKSTSYSDYSYYAYDLYFTIDSHAMSDYYRYYGYTVRPVLESEP